MESIYDNEETRILCYNIAETQTRSIGFEFWKAKKKAGQTTGLTHSLTRINQKLILYDRVVQSSSFSFTESSIEVW